MIASRTPLIRLLACFCVTLGATYSQAGLYDAAADFSPTVNPNGVWSYGESLTLGSPFIIDSIHQNTGDLDFWEGTIATGSPPGSFPYVVHNGTGSTNVYRGTLSITAGQLGLHPGPDGEYGIVRFTAPSADIYSLNSAFSGLDFAGPTSTDVHVLLDGASIFDSTVSSFGSGPTFSQSLALQAGDTVDFAVGYGPNRNYFNDGTSLSATLSTAALPTSAVPEPGNLILASIATITMAGYGGLKRSRARLRQARS